MEKIKNLIDELKRENYSKYKVDLRFYVPFKDDKFVDYEKFDLKQKRVFRLSPKKTDEALKRVDVCLIAKKLFTFISEESFAQVFKYFSDIVDAPIEIDIFAKVHLPIDKFIPIPSLPTLLDKDSETFGTPLLTGVRITFDEAKKDLKAVALDVSPCTICGKVDLTIILSLKKKCKFSADEMIKILSDVEEYSKYFYKVRDAK